VSLVDKAAGLLERRSSRRGFLARAAVVGSAVVVAPVKYLLHPTSAYAAACGIDSTCGSGYTVFCCTVNDGINKCPPGTFVGGWWKADGSAFCCDANGASRPRYYIDCQGSCTKCSNGCGGYNSFCTSSCRNCSCRCGSSETCDQRKVCCNNFRYGQCHTEIACGGPVACRVVTCVPPYQLYPSCGTSSATDNRTAHHSAPCLTPGCR
jgi:hypothetical protein